MIRVNFRIPFGILMLLLRMSFDRSHGIPWLLGVLFLFGAMVPLARAQIQNPASVPVLTPLTNIPSSSSERSPVFQFSSTEVGTITYGGPCYFSHTPTLEIAVAGTNTVTYGPMAVGTYSGCTITVTNAAGEAATATIADFEIVPETGTENHTVQVSTDRQTVAWDEEFTITLKTEIPVLAVVDDYNNENFHHLGHTDVHIKQLVTFGHIGTIDPPEQPQADLKNFTFAARISYIGNFKQLLDGFDLHLQVHTERFRFKSCSQTPCWNSPSNIVPIVLDPFKYSITGVTAPIHFDKSRSKFNVTITTDAVALTQFDQSLININEGRVVPNSEIYNGNEVTFKIEPQSGNEITIESIGKGAFREVSYNGTRAYNTPVTIPSATLPKFDLTIDKGAGTGKGTVTGDGLSCTVDDASNTTSGVCIVSVPGGGARYIFKAVPAAGSVFGGWNGTCDDPQDLDLAIAGAETCFHPIEDEAATVTPVFELASSLSIEITDDDPNPVPAGSLLTYTVAVTNSGTVDATGVIVDATLPAEFSYTGSGGDPSAVCTMSTALQCTIPTVRADETVTFKLIGYVDVAAVDPLTLEVAVSSTSLDDERTELNPKTDSQETTVTAPITSGTVSIVKETRPAVAGNDTFVFGFTPATITPVTLTTVNNTATSDLITMDAGSIIITETAVPGWSLKSAEFIGGLNGVPVVDVASGSVGIDLMNDGDVVCTFISERDSEFVIDRTQTVIRNFITDRADQIAAGELSLAQRLIDRSGSSNLPVNVNGLQLISAGLHELALRGEGVNPLQTATLETSLQQVLSYQHRQEQPYLPASARTVFNAPRYDVWVRARYSRLTNEGRIGDLGLIYFGGDYLISPDLLIGGIAQIDTFDQKDDDLGATASGTGWMTGPYMVARLNDQLLFEGRAAWGMSYNDVNPLGTYVDEFETTRWLLKGAFTGEFARDGWRFNPAMSAFWMQDRQEKYTDRLGIVIPGQSIDLGQLTFGSRLSREIEWSNGLTVTPSIQVQGVWNFAAPEQVSTAEPLRARLKTGLSVTGFEGLTINASGHLDGIGVDDVLSYGGEIQLSIPLQ